MGCRVICWQSYAGMQITPGTSSLPWPGDPPEESMGTLQLLPTPQPPPLLTGNWGVLAIPSFDPSPPPCCPPAPAYPPTTVYSQRGTPEGGLPGTRCPDALGLRTGLALAPVSEGTYLLQSASVISNGSVHLLPWSAHVVP